MQPRQERRHRLRPNDQARRDDQASARLVTQGEVDLDGRPPHVRRLTFRRRYRCRRAKPTTSGARVAVEVGAVTDLSLKIGRLQLRNPVLTASGTFGWGHEYAKL